MRSFKFKKSPEMHNNTSDSSSSPVDDKFKEAVLSY